MTGGAAHALLAREFARGHKEIAPQAALLQQGVEHFRQFALGNVSPDESSRMQKQGHDSSCAPGAGD